MAYSNPKSNTIASDAISSRRPSLGIIGAGRAGATMALAAHKAGYGIDAIYSRNRARAAPLVQTVGAEWVDSIDAVAATTDLILIAVPDDTISLIDREGAASWRVGSGVVHLSGLHSSEILQYARHAGALTGTLHPLQAFSDPLLAQAILPGSTFGISGHPSLLPKLKNLVEDLGAKALPIPDLAKDLYHAAAVFASNYLITCFSQAVTLFADLGISEADATEALLPLASGAVANLSHSGLPDALTGPISRGDNGTVAKHLLALSDHEQILELYRCLGKATVTIAADQGHLAEEEISAVRGILSDKSP